MTDVNPHTPLANTSGSGRHAPLVNTQGSGAYAYFTDTQGEDAVWPVPALKSGAGELFLSFTTAALGQCALPVQAVQTVASADGPFRAVPGRGLSGSHFLGLVSVRGQVQMLFDLCVATRADGLPAPVDVANRTDGLPVPADVANSTKGPAAPAQSEFVSVPPALVRGEHLVVAVAGDGRTLALRVRPQLRLVRGEVVAGTHPMVGEHSSTATLAAAPADLSTSSLPPATADSAASRHSTADGGFASLVRGTLLPLAGQTQEIYLLCVDALFTYLEKEVARG